MTDRFFQTPSGLSIYTQTLPLEPKILDPSWVPGAPLTSDEKLLALGYRELSVHIIEILPNAAYVWEALADENPADEWAAGTAQTFETAHSNALTYLYSWITLTIVNS